MPDPAGKHRTHTQRKGVLPNFSDPPLGKARQAESSSRKGRSLGKTCDERRCGSSKPCVLGQGPEAGPGSFKSCEKAKRNARPVEPAEPAPGSRLHSSSWGPAASGKASCKTREFQSKRVGTGHGHCVFPRHGHRNPRAHLSPSKSPGHKGPKMLYLRRRFRTLGFGA